MKGLLASGCSPQNIWATNRSAEKNQQLRDSLGIHVSENNHDALEHADIAVLGVKPQQMQDLAVDIAAVVRRRNPLIISVAIGITTVQLNRWFGKHDISIVRSMPNTPALVSAGACGLFANSWVTQEQKNLADHYTARLV
ncbi:MAG: NAD(P)-binding domain-containing protein [Gammaproteobacteria bacterium]|nr:NAD(P)-binding domain-containing protein [Gammaproteobacteria bacterium]